MYDLKVVDLFSCTVQKLGNPQSLGAYSGEFRTFKKKTIYMIGIVVTTIGS